MDPAQWNKKKNEPRQKPAKLIELEDRLKESYRQLYETGHTPTLTDLIGHKATKSKLTIVEWCDDYCKGLYSQKHEVATVRSNMKDFNEALTFERFKRPVIKDFFEHLSKKGVANNSQYKRLTALKNVMEHANLNLPDLVNYSMPYSTSNSIKVRLTWDEVKKIIDTPAKAGINQTAKEVFLLACFSGLRIGDILTLQKGTLHDFYYERTQGKTKVPVLVTVHRYNEDLFRKHIGGIKYSRQKLSRALKETLKQTLTGQVTKIQAVGYGHKETELFKWQEISFHSGRRFYARLLNDLGLGQEIARDELGHSYRSVTELYSGSQEHNFRIARVRKAMGELEKTLEELSLMKVA